MTASDAEQASKENGCHPRCCREPAADVAVAVGSRIDRTQLLRVAKKAKATLEVEKSEFAKCVRWRCLRKPGGRARSTANSVAAARFIGPQCGAEDPNKYQTLEPYAYA